MEAYSGDICRDELTSLQTCFSGATSATPVLNIPVSMDQVMAEEQAVFLINGLRLYASPECVEVAVPYICLTFFPLCDSDNDLHTVSRDECVFLKNDICADTFRLAERVLGSSSLPVCGELPDISNDCNGN